MINPQQWQNWKMMTTITFNQFINFLFSFPDIYHFLSAYVDCTYGKLNEFVGGVFI